LAVDDKGNNFEIFASLLQDGLNEIQGFITQKEFLFLETEEDLTKKSQETVNGFLENLRCSIIERKSRMI
jgi:hypothetical protein